MGATWFAVCAVFAVMTMGPAPAVAAFGSPGSGDGEIALKRRLLDLEAELDAQEEARDRQADAFAAAATRIELISGTLVLLVTLAGVLTALLALRIVRQAAERRVEATMDAAVDAKSKEVFDFAYAELRREYDDKFTELYRRFKRVVDDRPEETR